jgi:DNA topoisomerase-1
MAKTKEKSLVIVESPAKAKTISRFLGPAYAVEASIGHVRDLPGGAKEVPEKYKGEEWARLGVNVNDGFTPLYIVPADKKKQVAKLRELLKDSKELFLATDEDREGEAISWHLQELLQPKVPVFRLVFHEITKEAIDNALANPRSIDEGLVRAQETRRILDRLYGYEVSPLLWRKVGPRLSAGRVQSVAVRLIVDLERQRMAFRSATWWDLLGSFAAGAVGASNGQGKPFQAGLVSVNDRKIPSGKDFDSATGAIKNAELLLLDEAGAKSLADQLARGRFSVGAVTNKPDTLRPSAPFTTSTMQQEANRKLGFTARRTMGAAQGLYENGYITYMRTDSTTLSKEALDAARELIQSQYGESYLPPAPRAYASKVKNAQEAHEAIRPAGHPFRLPESLRGELSDDQFRLYELIWKRTIASQMVDARIHRMTILVEGAVDDTKATFSVSGRTIDFPGYLRAYVEGSDDPEAELADRESLLPAVQAGDAIECRGLDPKSHATQPPARYTEASLTKSLEEMGIGRPSTYASIIDTILAREYVFKKGNALVPTWTAFSVVKLLEQHLESLVDYAFTAKMEDDLDAISRREAEHLKYLQTFYFGEGSPGLKAQVEQKISEIDAREVSRFPLGAPTEGEHREEIVLRVGRFGPFLEQGERRASIPDGTPPDEIDLVRAIELLDRAAKGDEPLGFCPDTNRPVFLKNGRFGPYVQLGAVEEGQEPKNASLLKGMDPSEISFELALKLLTLPRTVGEHPESHEPIIATSGKFGPYIKCGTDTRSLPEELSPLDIGLEQALELLAQPKTRGRGRAAPREPLKVFPPSPVTNEPIKLLAGRYGPYVADGATNASLPRGATPEELTFEQAVILLAERAAKAPPKKKAAKKTAKTTAKKTAAKKTSKKAAKNELAESEVSESEVGESGTGAEPKKAIKKAAKKAAKKKTAKKAATKRGSNKAEAKPDATSQGAQAEMPPENSPDASVEEMSESA